jgi:LPS sulfotransferase NodH
MNSCWILCDIRTGSTYLSGLLNGTGLFPLYEKRAFDEWFARKRNFIPDKETFISKPPLYAKVLIDQFNKLFTVADKPLIESKVPNLKYILLRRKDIVAQAVSYYIADMTGYILTPKNYSAWNTPVVYDEAEIRKRYKILKDNYEIWMPYLEGSDYLEIDYETLVAEPKKTLIKVLDYLEMNYDEQKLNITVETLPTTKKENAVFIQKFKSDNVLFS